MREIKAYIGRCCVNKVVDELEQAGAPGITVVEIHPVGYGYEPNCFEQRVEDAFKRYSYLRIVKLEVVCSDKDVERLVAVIERVAHSGGEGDGMIFVAEVTDAIRVRDGVRGDRALMNQSGAGRHREDYCVEWAPGPPKAA